MICQMDLLLSEDLLLNVAALLPPSSYEAARAASSTMRGLLTVQNLRLARSAPHSVQSIEELEVHERVSAIASNRVTFEGASTELREGYEDILSQYAALVHRHPRALIHIEAHTGRNAPATFAPSFTRERAATVRTALVEECGVASNRITCKGWGKDVAVHARWPAGRHSARAELYIKFNGSFYPDRPEYYATCPAARTPQDSESDGEADQQDFASLLQQLMQHQHLIMQQQEVEQAAAEDQNEEDEDEDEDEIEDEDEDESDSDSERRAEVHADGSEPSPPR